MNFEESVEYMSGLMRFGWKLDNSRIEALCERFGNPQLKYSVIHITGTKGKGSTTALCAAILKEQGYRTGGYFSPYVYDIRERIQVDGEMIPKEDFAKIVSLIRPVIEELAQTEVGQTTEFELKTLTAFLYFAQKKVEFACIEVGIGGRLDATNVVQPVVTVITNIGLDHTEILGDTYAKIAGEKAGIIKIGVPCFTASANVEALEVIKERARAMKAPLKRVVPKRGIQLPLPEVVLWSAGSEIEPPSDQNYPDFADLTVATPRAHYEKIVVKMGGLYQRENAACAIAATEEALSFRGETLRTEAVRRALSQTSLPARLSISHSPLNPLIVIDGAHNGLSAQKLLAPILALKKKYQISRTHLVIGMVGGHEPDDVLSQLAPLADACFACQVDWKRTIPAETIAETALKYCPVVTPFPNVDSAFQSASEGADQHTLILITGSLYLAGALPPELLGV